MSAIVNILTPEATSTEIHPLITTAQLEDNQQTTLISPSPLEELGITQNRAVRMSTENLNRLMGLAGESLVEANLLEPFANSLLKLRKNQGELSNLLEKLQDLLGNYHLDRQIKETLSATHQKANECYQMMSDRQNELEQFSQRSANLSQRLYQEVIATRMCSFADGGQGFPRMMRDLARQLGKRVKMEMRVQLAIADSTSQPGKVLLAGTNLHLVMRPDLTFGYDKEPLHFSYRPSVDVFFNSVAKNWTGKGVGALLTGMSRDGAQGLKQLREAGWHTIAQDRKTCVVYGMPKVAVELKAAVEVLPIEAIASACIKFTAKYLNK
ncbi:chemotaxis protein CheB [Nostoc sp.]|uniref:chemotaxis protein CheB n=1 Tax=Nostoc sp. TaxID=1180 RepID=UPI002FFC178B